MSCSGKLAMILSSAPIARNTPARVLRSISARFSILAPSGCFTRIFLASLTCVSFRASRRFARSISWLRVLFLSAARAIASAGIFATSSENGRVPGIVTSPSGSFEMSQMFVKQSIRDSNKLVIKSVVAALPSADQKDRRPSRVEGVQDSERLAATLYAQLLHRTVTRSVDTARVGKGKVWSPPFKLLNIVGYVLLFIRG